MARTDTLGHFLTDIADAIREKTGESGTIQASSFDTQISNIPSGGTTINGQLLNKLVQSGDVTKGDFVTMGTFNLNDRLSTSNNYLLVSGASISNEANMYDNNDNNYATISYSSGNPRIYVQCKSREQLNIPTTAKLLSVTCNYKVSWAFTASQYAQYVGVVKFRDGDKTKTTTNTAINYNNDTKPVIANQNIPSFLLNADDDTSYYGFQVYVTTTNNSIYLYYASFDITYEADNEIKKVTSEGEYIVGVANESGTQGDTIQIYIPNEE